MKTTRRLLLGAAWLAVVAYGIYATARIRHLEARLRHAPSQLSYAFDHSFMRYFGQRGVDVADRAVSRGVTDPDQLAREVSHELKQK
jgi:hypothetical protein